MLAFKILFKEIFYLLNNKASRTFLWLAFKFGEVPRYQQRTVKFWNYQLQVPDCLSFIWQFKEIFVEESYRFQSPNPEPIIFDCGANIGLSCLYLKNLFPKAKIYAFEADPEIARILTQNLQNNQIEGVEVIAKAVWESNGEIEFSAEGADGGSVFSSGKKIKLPAVRLRTMLLKHKKIDFLKMDIEGAEVAVLKDCADAIAHIEHIFIEYHAYLNQKQELNALLKILTDNGFRYFLKDEQTRKSPLENHFFKNNRIMDLQVNIFAYKNQIF
jgi:FkbM family methyltransferase